MLKKLKTGKHLEIILIEMCARVGTNFNDIDIMKDMWQEEHEWTIDEEIKFQEWMFQYVVANHDALLEISDYRPNEPYSTNDLIKLVKEFTLLYGWALGQDGDLDYIKENKP
jgi:hypothetical protein